MQVLAAFIVLALSAAITAWFYYGPAFIKRKAAHYLMASAAGDIAREQAVSAAMKQTLRLEGE